MLPTVATITAMIAIAVSGFFATNTAAIAQRVDSLAASEAAVSQSNQDIDARLTRIENKLDQIRTVQSN